MFQNRHTGIFTTVTLRVIHYVRVLLCTTVTLTVIHYVRVLLTQYMRLSLNKDKLLTLEAASLFMSFYYGDISKKAKFCIIS
jgi:hypothetical protein